MAAKRVLLVGSLEHDTSVTAVRACLEGNHGAAVTVVDGKDFGLSSHASARFGDSIRDLRIVTSDGELDLEELHAIWLRRWHDPRVLEEVDSSRGTLEFARENWARFVSGLWLSSGVRCVNHPAQHWAAANKLYQLRAAPEVGLPVPATLCTTDPTEAGRFIDEHHAGVVCKAIGSTFSAPATKTVLVERRHLAALETVSVTPTLLQEFVPVHRDIRVIVIGTACFAGEISTAEGADPIDWRADVDNPWRRHRLPAGVEQQCVELTRALGLEYGAIDLRLTPDGDYVFFEINPGGQFLFLEIWTGLPIVEALADYLLQ